MSVMTAAGAECRTRIGAVTKTEGEFTGSSSGTPGIGAAVTLVAGPLRTGSRGAYYYHCDEGDSTHTSNDASCRMSKANNVTHILPGSGATTAQCQFIMRVNNGSGTAVDQDLFDTVRTAAVTAGVTRGVRLIRLRLSDAGKVHLFDKPMAGSVTAVANNGGGTIKISVAATSGLANNDWVFHQDFANVAYNGYFQVSNVVANVSYVVTAVFTATGTGNTSRDIDPTNAWTMTSGSTYGIIMELDLGTPFNIRVYSDALAGAGPVAKQAGNAFATPLDGAGGGFSFMFATGWGKGVWGDCTIDFDDFVAQDNGNAGNNSTLISPTGGNWTYWEVVLEGVPSADDYQLNTNFHNQAAANCGTSGTVCSTSISEEPVSLTNYIEMTGAVEGRQYFLTTSKILGLYPTAQVGALRTICTWINIGQVSGAHTETGINLAGTSTRKAVSGQEGTADVNGAWLEDSLFANSDTSSVAWTAASARAAGIGVEAGNSLGGSIRIGEIYKIAVVRIGRPAGARNLEINQTMNRAATY